jgi:hypothetical protein
MGGFTQDDGYLRGVAAYVQHSAESFFDLPATSASISRKRCVGHSDIGAMPILSMSRCGGHSDIGAMPILSMSRCLNKAYSGGARKSTARGLTLSVDLSLAELRQGEKESARGSVHWGCYYAAALDIEVDHS